MRTDELIHSLAADMRPSRSLTASVVVALAAGFALSALLFWIMLGPRADLAAAAATVRFDLKVVEMLLLAAAAGVLVLRLARPGADVGPAASWLLVVPILLAAAALVEFVLVGPQWRTKLVGSNSLVCLTAIPLLALPVLAALLYALRQGASTWPGLTGAVAGLAAAGLAAALYALQCTDDSPLFVATWYPLAILIVSLLGAAAAQWLLRW
ncbi:MAG: NrsF family protein [Xanthobacteraceae bacterium]